jgi:hypothetical protein
LFKQILGQAVDDGFYGITTFEEDDEKLKKRLLAYLQILEPKYKQFSTEGSFPRLERM